MAMQTWKLRTSSLALRMISQIAPRTAANIAYTQFMTPRRRHTSTRDQDVMRTAERLNATYAEGSLVGYAWGDGPVILLVHGWEGSVRNFTAMVTPLVNAGFRVIAFDAPAHGDSDGSRTNILDYARVLSALITEYGPVYGVVAHSFGVPAIVFMMSTMMHYRIKRLVLVGAPDEMGAAMSRFAGWLKLTKRTLNHMFRLTHERLGLPISAFSVKSMISYIATPGLVIHDRKDSIVPFSEGERVAAHWPDAEFIATDGLGHNGALRSPEIIERITHFMIEPQADELNFPQSMNQDYLRQILKQPAMYANGNEHGKQSYATHLKLDAS